MTTAVVNPALGRSSGSFTLAGCSINSSTGVITPGTARTITGQILSWEVSQSNEDENISASTSRSANHVIIETDAVLTMEGFLFANDTVGTPTNYVWSIAQSNDYVQAVGSWAGRTETFYGIMKSYKESITGKGKIGFTAEFAMVDIGTANPAYA